MNVPQEQPIFSLSHRLLAFASSPPRPGSPTGGPSPAQPRGQSRPTSGAFSVTQADLGSAALKVGGSVLSGMKSLGGLAYSAAKSRVTADQGGAVTKPSSTTTGGALNNLFFSRSAPAASGSSNERRESITSLTNGGRYHQEAQSSSTPPDPPFTIVSSRSKSPSGHHITILDLGPLVGASPAKPVVISHFIASKHQHVCDIEFTRDGNAIIASPEDGKAIRVFHIKPVPAVCNGVCVSNDGNSEHVAAEPWHVYNLRRGRTPAVVESVAVSEDGRWAAVGTRKRTVHVFPVNPYGGKPDARSHLEGRVRNVTELVSTHLYSLFLLLVVVS